MRTNLILTVTAITMASAGAAFYILQDDTLPKQEEVAKSSVISTPHVTVTSSSISQRRRDQPADPERQQFTHMNEKIAALEARLRDLEATAGEQAEDQTVPRPVEPQADKGAEKAKPKRFSQDE